MKIFKEKEIREASINNDIQVLEQILREAIENKLSEGFEILPNLTYQENNHSKQCCAIGSLFVSEPDDPKQINPLNDIVQKTTANLSSILKNDITFYIAFGFDSGHYYENCRYNKNSYFNLGMKLRKEYSK